MTNIRNNLHANLTRSVTLFMAYCGLVRACRDQYGFLRGKPAVLGIVIPEGSDLGIYEDAVAFVALGKSFRRSKWSSSIPKDRVKTGRHCDRPQRKIAGSRCSRDCRSATRGLQNLS
jgi:hypothetical protein